MVYKWQVAYASRILMQDKLIVHATESVFGIHGMGTVAVLGILQLEYQIVMGVTLLTSVIFLLSNLIVDIAYAIVDPRVRLE